jgi:membrane-bound lytic murein transglycosylase D
VSDGFRQAQADSRQAQPDRPLSQVDSFRQAQADKTDSITHVVQPKETLYSISKKYGVSLEQLKAWNKLDSMDLKTGQQLVIHKN